MYIRALALCKVSNKVKMPGINTDGKITCTERNTFDCFVSNGEHLDHKCINCDTFGFPCLNCAQHVYDYALGTGGPDPSALTPQELRSLLNYSDNLCTEYN